MMVEVAGVDIAGLDTCQDMTENNNKAACMYNIYSFIKQN